MAGNDSFARAKTAREDEFYTQLTDIEKEMRHYRKHFAGKTVFCNCDDPFESNFFKYFVLNFNRLGLKKLIATCYSGSPIAGVQLSLLDVVEDATLESVGKPYKAVVTTVYDKTGDGSIDMLDVAELFKSGENELSELKGDGDFRSPECLALMDEADIVVTNPPFSLFREYVATLVKHNKKFIIIGSKNAITYKDIFALFMENKLWLGYGFQRGDAYFRIPKSNARDFAPGVYDKDTGLVHFRNCAWFTNLDIKKRHEEMILVKKYSPDAYPKYVNYDAIEVSKTADIPCDYNGMMGVPITFLDKYNPDQFEIIGSSRWLGRPMSEFAPKGSYVSGGIRFYLPIKEDCSQNSKVERERERGNSVASMTGSLSGEKYRRMYERIVIRNKHNEQPMESQHED